MLQQPHTGLLCQQADLQMCRMLCSAAYSRPSGKTELTVLARHDKPLYHGILPGGSIINCAELVISNDTILKEIRKGGCLP